MRSRSASRLIIWSGPMADSGAGIGKHTHVVGCSICCPSDTGAEERQAWSAEGEIVLFDVDGTLSDGRIWRKATARPGVRDLLDTLAMLGFQLVVWSSGGEEYARRVAEALGLHGAVWRYAAKPSYPMNEEAALAAIGRRPALQVDDDHTERVADWPFMEWPRFEGPHRVAGSLGAEERLRAALDDIATTLESRNHVRKLTPSEANILDIARAALREMDRG
jgi:NLI interacting factor-like phosphatase